MRKRKKKKINKAEKIEKKRGWRCVVLVRLCGSVFVLLCGARVFFRAAVGMWSCREEANFVGVLLLDFLFFFTAACVFQVQ